MPIIETSGHFDTDAVRRLLDEYERGYHQHDRQLAAIACQSILLIEDAERLYEETERMSWEMHEAAKKIADGWYEELEVNRQRNAVLARENVKLRELVADMRKAFIHDACVCWCDHMPERCDGTCQYLRRMCELGIEVEP